MITEIHRLTAEIERGTQSVMSAEEIEAITSLKIEGNAMAKELGLNERPSLSPDQTEVNICWHGKRNEDHNGAVFCIVLAESKYAAHYNIARYAFEVLYDIEDVEDKNYVICQSDDKNEFMAELKRVRHVVEEGIASRTTPTRWNGDHDAECETAIHAFLEGLSLE